MVTEKGKDYFVVNLKINIVHSKISRPYSAMEERTSIRSVPSLTLFQRSSVGPSKLRKREKDHNERGDFWLLVKCAGAIIASALFFLLLAVLIVIFGR